MSRRNSQAGKAARDRRDYDAWHAEVHRLDREFTAIGLPVIADPDPAKCLLPCGCRPLPLASDRLARFSALHSGLEHPPA